MNFKNRSTFRKVMDKSRVFCFSFLTRGVCAYMCSGNEKLYV